MSARRYTPAETDAAFRELRKHALAICSEFAEVLAKGPARPALSLLAALNVMAVRTSEEMRADGFDASEFLPDARALSESLLDSVRVSKGDA